MARVAERSFGLGPLEPLLRDPAVDEVMVNGAGAGVGGARRAPGAHRRALRLGGRAARRDRADPRAAGPARRRGRAAVRRAAARRLARERGHRRRWRPTARCSPSAASARAGSSADELVAAGTWEPPLRDLLARAVRARLNILVSGGTGSGKTTTLNALSSFVAGRRADRDRSRTPLELRLRQPHVVRLEARPPNVEGRGEVTIRRLVRNALRMRPDRIVVGEVRGGEALDMLAAMTTGHDGSLSTVHAGSPEEALRRLETLALMAGVGLPHAAIREQVADAIDLVVHQARLRRRRAPRGRGGRGRARRRRPGDARALRAGATAGRAGAPRSATAAPSALARRDARRRCSPDSPARSRSAARGRRWPPSSRRRRRARRRALARAAARRAAGGARSDAARAPAAGAGRRRRAAGRRLAVAGPLVAGAACAAARSARRRPRSSRARRERWRAELARGAPRRGARARGRAGRWPRGPRRAGGGGRGRRARRRRAPSCAPRPARWRSARGPRTCSSACAHARGAPAWDTIVAAILLQRDAGGDLAGLLRSIAAGLEEAARVEADARSATAQARFTAWLVALLAASARPCWPSWPRPGYVVALLRAPLAPWLLGARGALPARGVRAHPPHRARGGGRDAPRALAVAGRALLLAVLAAVCAAGGIVELAAAGARTRPRRRRGRRRAAARRRWRAWAGARGAAPRRRPGARGSTPPARRPA